MLEVSGRIAILTEHPKVQDILKRAGLDNIMRIYRSEAEMIADAKEILRQTSSYRIDELQKAASSSATIQLPPQVVTPPSIPKGEFDEFRFEMGQQLADKLDNNQVPQYQHGVPGSATAPQQPQVTAPSGYVAPTAPQAPAGYEAQPQQGMPQNMPYAQPQTPQGGHAGYGTQYPAAPTYGGGYMQGGPGAPAGFGNDNRDQTPANFDYPTVQLPVANYSQAAAVPPSTPQGAGPEADPSEDPTQRGRKGAEERMRSPTARKSGSRRVGGREAADASGSNPEEAFSAYASPSASHQGHDHGAQGAGPTGYASHTQDPEPPNYGPIASPSGLIEEKSSSGKTIGIIVGVALLALVIFLFTLGGEEEGAHQTPPVAQEPVTPPPAPAPVDSAAVPAIAAPAEPAQPGEPTTTTPTAGVPAEPTEVKPPDPPAPKPEVKAPVAVKERPVKKPKTPKAVTPAPVVESTPEPEPEPRSSGGIADGQVRVTSDPSGAEVLVNFSKKGVTPLTITLGNNTNRIIVRKEGFKRFETTLSKATSEKELVVELTAEEGAAPVAPSRPVIAEEPPEPPVVKPEIKPEVKPEPKPEIKAEVKPKPKPEVRPEPEAPKIETRPEPVAEVFGGPGVIFMSSSPARADIIVDGKDTGKKTPAKLELPAGRHKVEMVKSGQRASVEHVINEGKNKALHLNLQ
jgi:PEGA domain